MGNCLVWYGAAHVIPIAGGLKMLRAIIIFGVVGRDSQGKPIPSFGVLLDFSKMVANSY